MENKMIIEVLFGLISSGFLSAIWMDIKEMKKQIGKIEDDIIIMNLTTPKRKTDIDRRGAKSDT